MRVTKILAVISSFSIPTFSFSTATPETAKTCSDPNNDNNDNNNNNMPQFRSVKRILERPSQHWVGDAFHVYPVFADLAFKEDLSPLLMFDYGAPKKFNSKVGHPRGVGQHPHRGFETVTIAFQGEVEHLDNKGNRGVIGPGDVQWMTAGRGIIHEEYHSKNFTQNGGTLEMCQLWVNLPKKHKMTKARYQPILKDQIPYVELPLNKDADTAALATVRLIAGELDEIKGKAKTFSPVQMWDVIMPHAGAEVDIPFPADHNCIVFVRRGRVQVLSGDDGQGKKSDLGPQDVAVMHLDGSGSLRIRVDEPDTSLLIMGGEPLQEPIAAQGPFVMNTHDEIRKAIADYRSGKF
jgi:redox-sensitive bicupin YhaK (pirin superfamily)